MKIDKKEIDIAREKFNKKLKEQDITIEYIINRYETGDFFNSHQVNNLKIRFLWDLYRWTMGNDYICSLYNKYDCNDNHIETIIKKVFPYELKKKY